MRYKLLFVLILISFVLGFFYPAVCPNKELINFTEQIVIFKDAKKLYLFKDKKMYRYDIATGKNDGDKQKVGDCRTPLGKFKIIAIEKSDTWAYDFEDDNLGPIVGAYGPWFLRFDGKWDGIAIHGTHDESSMGKNATHGCIRMRNQELIELKNMVSINFPVEVRP